MGSSQSAVTWVRLREYEELLTSLMCELQIPHSKPISHCASDGNWGFVDIYMFGSTRQYPDISVHVGVMRDRENDSIQIVKGFKIRLLKTHFPDDWKPDFMLHFSETDSLPTQVSLVCSDFNDLRVTLERLKQKLLFANAPAPTTVVAPANEEQLLLSYERYVKSK